jgi:hypothetical protein
MLHGSIHFPWSDAKSTFCRAGKTMDTPRMNITAISLSPDLDMHFSVYSPGWGYRAFSLPAEVICAQLGAAQPNSKQLSLAFELGRHRIFRAVQQTKSAPGSDGRVTLTASDF